MRPVPNTLKGRARYHASGPQYVLFMKGVNYFMRQGLKQRLDENAPDSAVSLFTMQAFGNEL
jgi:hypothetical protein